MLKKVIKKIYSAIPFKRHFFILVKKVFSLPHSIYKHLYFKGKFHVKVNDEKSFEMIHYGFEIENELFWRGLKNGWEKVSVGLWTKLCEKANVIVDIGANTGIYSLVAKTVNPHASVYAFEPVPRVFEKLERNFKLNRYDVHCFRQAVSNYTGKAIIYDTTEDHILSVTINKNLNPSSRQVKEYKIDTITLKDFIEQVGLKRIDLMKIDVETHEPEVLEGFGEYLKKFRPTILIEVLNDEVGAKVSSFVNGLNYFYFNIDENEGIRQVDEITHSYFYNYLLCNQETAKELNLI